MLNFSTKIRLGMLIKKTYSEKVETNWYSIKEK